MLDIILDTLLFGLPYAILALGVFISYRLLDFADMTCEGSFVCGGATAVVLIYLGCPAIIATLASLCVGMLAGFITGIIHTKLKVNGLLAGILTMTGFFSINMCVFGWKTGNFNPWTSYQSFCTIGDTSTDPTIYGFLSNLFDVRKYGVIIVMLLIVALVGVLVYFFFGTKVGMSMRATGMNQKMARAQGINTPWLIVLGLMLSNALIAFAASLSAQRDYTMASTSGTGMLVIGLASIIIGEIIFGKRSFLNWMISVMLGAVVYYFIIAIAIKAGFPDHLLKFLNASIIVGILAASYIKASRKPALPEDILAKYSGASNESEEVKIDDENNDLKGFDVSAIMNTDFAQPNLVVEPMDKPILSVKNVTKIFNRTGNKADLKVALNDLSVDVNQGDFITIIGGNGSGKSTFFNICSGVFQPEKGQIYICGEDVTKLPENKRAYYIGRVAQDPYQGTAHDMSILENMSIAMRRDKPKGLGWGFNKADTEFFKERVKTLGLGLEKRMSAKIGTLSGGQRQAVTLLMATLQRPELLFLDEHTAALDPKTAKIVLELTDKIVKDNKLTAVMVTHNMKDAITYGNRLLMFNKGKIIYDVSGEEKKNLTVEKLLKKFEDVEFSDKDILG